MTNEAKILTLIPEFRPLVRKWVDLANYWLSQSDHFKGDVIQITEGKRTLEYQAGLFSVGREWLAGLREWKVSGTVITNTMNSKHLVGEAFDYALWDTKNKVLSWPPPKMDINKQMYLALGQIAKDLGLWPGSHWLHATPDYVHIAYKQE